MKTLPNVFATNGVKLSVGILSLVLLLFGGFSVQTTLSAKAQDIADAVRGEVAGEHQERVELELVNGWNLIALPVKSNVVQTAGDLIESIAVQGGYVTTVTTWNGDRWEEISQRGAERYGYDFDLEYNKAYFVRNHEPVTWVITGEPLTGDDLAVELREGWNAVGLGGQQVVAGEFLERARGNAGGTLRRPDEWEGEIDRWRGGVWDPFVKRWYTAEDVEEYGENFELSPFSGFFVRVSEASSFRSEE